MLELFTTAKFCFLTFKKNYITKFFYVIRVKFLEYLSRKKLCI